MDPQFTSDGEPFGPVRYAQIVEERYLISKYINTSYLDLGKISYVERQYLLNFIHRDKEREREIIEQAKKDN